MSEERQYGRVEDYTMPFLLTAFVTLFLGLGTLWVIYGFVPTLILAWFADRAMVFAAARSGRD